MIVTFYSFKGGVGRSMAMANVGEILADWGYHVILCDWDLEAPGLERYMTSLEYYLASSSTEEEKKKAYNQAQSKAMEYKAKPGLMDLLKEYKEMMSRTPGEVERRLKRSEGEFSGEFENSFAKVGELYLRRPSTYAFPVSNEKTRVGSLRLLTAGKREGESYQHYAEDVRNFDWEEFYEQWAGDSYMEFFRRDLSGGNTDLVLIDSRTGVTEHGGVATHHLADMVVLLSAANEMNMEGTEWMARELSEPSLKEHRGGRKLKILPVPSRIEQTAEKEILVAFRQEFSSDFRNYARLLNKHDAKEFYEAVEIPYMPYYSFKERVVAREEEWEREPKLYKSYQALAQCIVNSGASMGLREIKHFQERDVISPQLPTSKPVKLLEGTLLLSYAQGEEPAARVLAEGLKAAGIRTTVASASPREASDNPNYQSGEAEVLNAVGHIILVGHKGFDQKTQAEFDYALKQYVLRPNYRLVPLLLTDVDPKVLPAYATRLRPIELPDDFVSSGVDLFQGLAAQISSDAPALLVEEQTSPFLGFGQYEEEHARFFFGRDAEVRELTKLVRKIPSGRARWLQIEGSNGSGKTSLARAGLVPAIRRGSVKEGPKDWKIVQLILSKNVFESLAVALYNSALHPSQTGLQSNLSERNGLKKVIQELTPPDHAFLLVLDNMEILFDGEIEKDVLASFDEQLADVLSDKDLPFNLVTTLRSDYVPSLELLTRLGNIFREEAERYQLENISESGLHEAIIGPVRVAGLNMEPELLERIAADVMETEQPLALLGSLLQNLWEKRTGNLLTHSAYQELGGVRALLIENADSVIDALTPAQLERARRLALELVRTSPSLKNGKSAYDTRRAIPVPEALMAAGGDEEARRLLNLLLGPPRLLVINEFFYVELLHESLVRHWSRLRRWIDDKREGLRRRDDISAAARVWKEADEFLRWSHSLQSNISNWEKSGRDETFLLMGSRLRVARQMLHARAEDLDDKEKLYIQESLKRTSKRRFKITASLTMAFLVVVILLTYWYKQQKSKNTQTASASIQQGQNSIGRGDYDRAIAELSEAIQFDSDSAEAYYYRGLAYASKNKHELAINDFEKAIELNPDLTQANIGYGITLAKKGEYQKAISKLETISDENSMAAQAYYYRGHANDRLGRMDEALKDYSKAIVLNPAYAEAYSNRAALYRSMGDFERAFAGYNRAIELNPQFAEAYNNRGYAYANTKAPDYDFAIEDYTKAIELKADFAEAYFNRGAAFVSKGDYDAALSDFDNAIKYAPDDAWAYNSRCTVNLTYKKLYDIALQDCTRAIDIKSGNFAEARSNRGQVYAALGEDSKAIEDFTEALKLDADLIEVYYYRGMSYKARNERARAIEDLKLFISATSDPKLEQAARQELGTLGYQTPPSETTISLRSVRANSDLLEALRQNLADAGYSVQVIRLGDDAQLDAAIKFFHGADEKNARDVKEIVEETISGEGYASIAFNASGLVRFGRATKVPFGIIEVSIPPLEKTSGAMR